MSLATTAPPRGLVLHSVFVGSDRGGIRAAAIYILIGTARLNDIDPQGWARGRPRQGSSTRHRPPRTSSCP